MTDASAGSAYLGPGVASATLGGTLADGGTVSAGLTHGDIHQRIDGYLNRDNFDFAPPAYAGAGVTAFGNLGRNIYRGPFQQNWDFSLIKNFRLTERQTLRFTADFFNIWNHTNFGNPVQNDVSFSAGSFALINSTVGTPRLIQFQLRYSF